MPAEELVRVTRDAAGGLVRGPGPGRGAWLHPVAACARTAAAQRAFERALRGPVDGAAVRALVAALEAGEAPGARAEGPAR